MAVRDKSSAVLLLIAIFKLLKAASLIIIGVAALRLIHRDLAEVAARWIRISHVDSENRYVHMLLERLPGLSRRKLEALGIGSFLYASIFVVEGTGLLLRRRWAEYMTVIGTSLLMPLELYELFRRPTAVRAGALVVNAAIVVYLIWRIRKARRAEEGQGLE